MVKCENCGKECVEKDMWEVLEPDEEGLAVIHLFCCQSCMAEALNLECCKHEEIRALSGTCLRCEKCGTKWKYNPVLKIYSSKHIGITRYLVEEKEVKNEIRGK